MGLCNTYETFQTLMKSISRDIEDVYIMIYMDDLLIFRKKEDEHRQHVETVHKKLKENEPCVSSKKCFVFQNEVEFTGLLSRRNGSLLDTARIEVFQRWPKPQNLTKFRRFIGLIRFFKHFIIIFF